MNITFINIFRILYIRNYIFQSLSTLPSTRSVYQDDQNSVTINYIKGRELSKQFFIVLIQTYAMPWDFLVHHLPPIDQVNMRGDNIANLYVSHKNATVSTLGHLLDDWLPKDVKVTRIIDAAVRSGNIDIVKMLHFRYQDRDQTVDSSSSDSICSTDAIDRAVRGGYNDIVEFLLFNRTEGYHRNTLNRVISNGNLPLIKLFTNKLAKQQVEWTPLILKSVFWCDNLDAIKYIDPFRYQYLASHGSELDPEELADWDNSEFLEAVFRGSLDILKYLHDNRPEAKIDHQIMDLACSQGNLDVLKAIDNAHLNIVEFLIQNRTEHESIDILMKHSFIYPRIDIFNFLNQLNNTKVNSFPVLSYREE
ncbi:hypothetical protein DFA_08142 [Cavenderia fasciculata]|uniref:Ankyrin repeat-containing protein n=1 Tax=Cavenderia fasciculata TaxID=261658 RepID=F4Q599_CACFS|nr:uncharacterized protein DFA_08142 [Cavenderia fasciculata]EGG17158.1 hypothetical protein DFA_08142 [Cavenderia fasciculata]|eukprot:XP_004355642.1 hypothetical protein DFA_08142 [Cavenderia fasciculata]